MEAGKRSSPLTDRQRLPIRDDLPVPTGPMNTMSGEGLRGRGLEKGSMYIILPQFTV